MTLCFYRWRVNSKEFGFPFSRKGYFRGYIKYGVFAYLTWHYLKATVTPSHHGHHEHGHGHGHGEHGHGEHGHHGAVAADHGHDKAHSHDSHGESQGHGKHH